MKCELCNSEWQPPKHTQSMFCPFCHTPLIEVPEEFENLAEVLLYLVQRFGTDVLRDKQNTLQFFEVFFRQGKQEYNFLNNLYASGLMDTLFRLRNSPKAIQKSATKQVEKQLTEKYGVSREWSEYVVWCVCKALGVADTTENSIIGLRLAAERGNLSAQVNLAKHYQVGMGVVRDGKKYVYWLRNAAENGHAEAQFLLGKELYFGQVCYQNSRSALMYLECAAKKHNIDAMCLILSDTELLSLCVLEVKKIAQYLLERKNELSSNQLIQLSKYFENANLSQALELAQLAHSKDAKSVWQYYVELLMRSGSHESKATALKVTKEMASEGNVLACLSLAHRYENQASTENDMLIALYWYRMAAENGNLDAQIRLGEIYEAGKLVKRDLESAADWYRLAAFNGSPYAKAKVNYKSQECILKTLKIIFEDDSELECRVLGVEMYLGDDYLIIEYPDTKECIPLKYTETDTIEGFEIEQVDEKTEKIVLGKFGSVSR